MLCDNLSGHLSLSHNHFSLTLIVCHIRVVKKIAILDYLSSVGNRIILVPHTFTHIWSQMSYVVD